MPELLPAKQDAQVFIRYGKVPSELEAPLKIGVAFQLKENHFILHVKNIASFYVIDGREIIIDKHSNANDFDIQVFLLGSAFGALLQQRNLLSIHGCSLCLESQNIIICGQSGAGKSSLAADFFKKGYPILNDDISVLETYKGKAFIHPGFPFLKLWKDSLEKLDIDYSNARRIRMQLEKFSIPLKDQFVSDRKEANVIFILKPHNKFEIELQEIKGLDKFNKLKSHIYRKSFLVGKENERLVFQQLSLLANQTRVLELKRPQTPFDTKNLVSIIKEQLK